MRSGTMRAGGRGLGGHHPVLHRATRAGFQLGHRVRIYYVEEDEGALTVDVMRLGAMQDTVQVSYRTEDGSAKAGRQYKPARGDLTFKPNELLGDPVTAWDIAPCLCS